MIGLILASGATLGLLWLAGITTPHRWVAAAYGLRLGLTGPVITASGLSIIGAVWGGVFIAACDAVGVSARIRGVPLDSFAHLVRRP